MVRRCRFPVAGAVLGIVFLYLWYCLDPRLLYGADKVVLSSDHWIDFPVFLSGWDFLEQKLVLPGGLIEYLAAGALQYFYYSAAGPLILTTVIGAVWCGTARLWPMLRAPAGLIAQFVPIVALLVAFNRYTFHLASYFGLVAALLLVSSYVRLAHRRSIPMCLATFVVLSVPTCHAIGGAYLLAAGSCGLYEWSRRRRISLACLYFLSAVALPVVGRILVISRTTYIGPGMSWSYVAREAFATGWPAGCYLLFLLVMSVSRAARRHSPWIRSTWRRIDGTGRLRRSRLAVRSAVLLLLAVAAVLVSWDREARTLLKANDFARRGRWPELVDLLVSAPPAAYPPGLVYDINRALFETGQLGDRMFAFPQSPEFGLQISAEAMPQRSYHETLLQLGCANEAEHVIHESLEVIGLQPYLLSELATINLAKGQPGAARVFLNVLSRDIVWGEQARADLARLDRNEPLSSDEAVRHLRSVMLQQDVIAPSSEQLLLRLLRRNPANRMAFEYLMAHYLSTGQLQKVVEAIPQVRAFGYDRLPEHYAEAVLLYGQLAGRRVDLGGWTLTEASVSRFRTLVELTRGPDRDRSAIERVASGTYYTHYFLYSGQQR
jgi:hypothetical protein